jgi:OmpA-OmpF porin, OOP family
MTLLGAASIAFGQTTSGGDLPDLNAQHFRPTVDGQRTLWTDDAGRGLDRQVSGRLVLGYADDPLVYQLEDGTQLGIVDSVLQADLIATYTLGRLRFGVDVPVYLSTVSELYGGGPGFGDLALDGKVTLLDGASAPVRVAAGLRLALPTSITTTALGSSGARWEASAIVDRSFGPVLLAANVGFHAGPEARLENVYLNDAVSFRAAASYALDERTGLSAEIAGQLATGSPLSNGASTPIEWLGGGYRRVGDDVIVRAGAGTGITSGVMSPDFRLVLGVGFSPDLRVANIERSPAPTPELAVAPPPAEPAAPVSAPPVAPSVPAPVVVADIPARVDLREVVYFDTDSDVLLPDGRRLLDGIALTLSAHPELLRLRVEGHTDPRGSEVYNLGLSERRAAAVRAYLIGRGVAAERLEVVDYGESQPYDARDVSEAWRVNRRVEIVVAERSD